jgi:hypothetical protein
MTKPRYDLGILLVHGIGAQKRGDTLLQFGEPMAESLNDWLDEGAVKVRRTQLLQPSAAEPANSQLTVTRNGTTKTVLVAESWWANTFGPPAWWPFAKWLLWSAPFVILRATDHRVSMIATHNKLDRDSERLLRRSFWEFTRVLKNALSVVIALVAAIGVLALGVLAVIPRVRTSFLAAQRLLVGYVGDCYLLLISRGRGDAMVSQVERDLQWLEHENELGAVAVIAHSQGAEVVRRMLERREDEPPVDLLITLGSGIAKLRAVQNLHGQAWRALRAYGYRLAAAALTLAGPALAVAGVAGWWIAVGAVVASAPFAAPLISAGRRRLKDIVCEDELPADRLRPVVGKVNRWRDFFATSDPVPEDALPFDELSPPTFPEASSTQIANRRSPLLDHTSYWQNAESFRAPVIAELARLVGWRPAKPTRRLIEEAHQRRLRTSKRLVAVRYVVASLAALIVLLPGAGVARATWDDAASWLGARADSVAGLVREGDDAWMASYPERHLVALAIVVLVALVLNGGFASRWHAAAGARGRMLLRAMPAPRTGEERHEARRRFGRRRRRSTAGPAGSAGG